MRAHKPGKWTGREVSDVERLAIFLRSQGVCAYCGQSLWNASPGELTIDHLVSRRAGGLTSADNLVLACFLCTSGKGNRDWRCYAPGGAQDRILEVIARPLNLELAAALRAGRILTDEEIARA